MPHFRLTSASIDVAAAQRELADPAFGGYVAFEGWVRDFNEGRRVEHLEYEAFEPLAVREGERILAEACERHGVTHALCIHRIGDLAIGELAVWVGVSAPHRDEAFRACRQIIDEVKHRVPIWKKEHYEDGDSGWVNCERCAAPAPDPAGPAPAVPHDHDHSHGHDRHVHTHADHAARVPAPDYSRQMALREVGAAGQARLAAASVLVVGAGGLGVPVLQYLAAAGIGRLGIVDHDRLEPSNLHRQTMYSLADCGRPKAQLAAARLRELGAARIDVHVARLDASNVTPLLTPYDIVVDCTDNFATKLLLNDAALALARIAVFASVYQYEGQLQVVDPGRGTACLRCVWPAATRDGLVGNCATAGVLGPVPGTLGTLQALEVLKVLLDLPGRLGGEVMLIDLLSLATRRLQARPAADHHSHGRQPAESTAADIDLSFESIAAAATAGYTIVDIREPAETAVSPIVGAPVQELPLGALLSGAPLAPGERHLLVCAHGMRSHAAAEALRARGLRQVYSLRGGTAALAQAGLRRGAQARV
ncbi:MAG TPA: ThiF family adenylyltransferase [Steroidobacteraceae bacterium]|nr:ThiF family adenylyltransferase [Steroidobacteraceae bacterium]HNS28162.1 ThiF family adenylyltransferase [Steroidobacteraceae bacterium]